ncbi:MAG TPA: GDP-mannose 4,6-dehydratase [Chitinophagaceae bacterium]|nr:GDP-mannose 4,6-dehydratase [Chitinophagaceae bacterium]
MKKAIIVGAHGQDGQYLSEKLRHKGYMVIGLDRNVIEGDIFSDQKPVDITKSESVQNLLEQQKPNEIYYLAAFHQSSEDKNYDDGVLFQESFSINVQALFNFLEGIKLSSPATRLFYAASSHIFGNPDRSIQDETTPFRPNCIYGLTKTAGLQVCRYYRERYSIFTSVGILYNHESPLRSPQFISQKIVRTMIEIKKKKAKNLTVGNLKAKIDWGYAADYVEAMYRILQLPDADDFIISSGSVHTIEDFIKGVAHLLDLNWKSFVQEDPNLITKITKGHLQGNHQKLSHLTGWTPTVDLEGLIKIMVEEGLKNYAA